MKPIDDPVPSGERLMGRQLIMALGSAGFEVRMASRLRSFMKEPDATRLADLERQAEAEAGRLLDLWSGSGFGRRPRLWFTYHLYYKAPDLLGPALARRLAIPYVAAECSYTQRRTSGPWARWQEVAAEAMREAALLLCLTGRDRAGIELGCPGHAPLVDLPPFLAASPLAPPPRTRPPSGPLRLVTVAMMRPGDKLASYRILADALSQLGDVGWQLTVLGDGPARPDVAQAFARVPADRITWRGAEPAARVVTALDSSDALVWPGCGEAYGLAYLEAAARGVPAVAMRTAGVPAVVVDGETGLLTADGDAAAFASAIRRLASDRAFLAGLGQRARRFVHETRSLDGAAAILRSALTPLVGASR